MAWAFGTVRSPAETHPKRPVRGLACHRREVSGQRLWDFLPFAVWDAGAIFRAAFGAQLLPAVVHRWRRRAGRQPDTGQTGQERDGAVVCRLRPPFADGRAVAVAEPFGWRRRLCASTAAAYLRRACPVCVSARLLHPSPANPAGESRFCRGRSPPSSPVWIFPRRNFEADFFCINKILPPPKTLRLYSGRKEIAG